MSIIDRNDNKPQFLNDTFDFYVEEGAASLIEINLAVYDADFSNNSELNFSKTGLNCDIMVMESERLDEHNVSVAARCEKCCTICKSSKYSSLWSCFIALHIKTHAS